MTETEARLAGAVVLVGAVLAVAAGAHGILGGGRLQARRAARVGARLGLEPELVDRMFVRRVVRRYRFVVGGLVLGLLASWLTGGPLSLGYAGLAVGAVVDQLATPRPAPGTRRVAHPVSRRLTDYVPGWLVGVTAAAAAGPAVLGVLGRLAAPDTAPRGSLTMAAGLVLLPAAALAGALAVARHLIDRPQPAASAEDLQRNEAIRAQAVRDILQLSAAVSLVTAWRLADSFLGPDIEGTLRRVAGLLPLGLLLGVLVVGLVHELTGGPRHWRRRLVAA